ncbi:MAG: hypothetical protein RIT81_14875 [Deltaproteobacteria bacterium]
MAKEVFSVRLEERARRTLKARAARVRLKPGTYAAKLIEAALLGPQGDNEETASPRLFERLSDLEARLVQLQLVQAEVAGVSHERLDQIRRQAFAYLELPGHDHEDVG